MEQIHFIGIGGIGMSALALLAVERGASVSGSDLATNNQIELLRSKGAVIYEGHDASHVPEKAFVVCSTDIKEDNPERMEAKRRGLPLLHRSTLLASEMENKKPLLVTGTHGKTTTSTLLAHTLMTAGLDPTFVLGGISLNYGSNVHIGKGDYFVAEADESDGTHMVYPSFGATVTNIDNDHLAHYGSIEAIEKSLISFLEKVPDPNRRIFCIDDERLRRSSIFGKSYGFHKEADCQILSYEPCEGGSQLRFLEKESMKEHAFFLPLFGRHNGLNAASVFLMARSIGISPECIQNAFASFRNVRRRLESTCRLPCFDLFDDYAHHPTEVKATIQALKDAYPTRRLVVLFQPHRPSRLRHVHSFFDGAFRSSDLIVLTDLYLSSETHDASYSHEDFISFVKKTHEPSPVRFIPRSDLAQGLLSLVQPNDVMVCMGAGDSTKVAREVGAHLMKTGLGASA